MSKVVKVKDIDKLIHDTNRQQKKWKKALAKYSKHTLLKLKKK